MMSISGGQAWLAGRSQSPGQYPSPLGIRATAWMYPYVKSTCEFVVTMPEVHGYVWGWPFTS